MAKVGKFQIMVRNMKVILKMDSLMDKANLRFLIDVLPLKVNGLMGCLKV
jgi:hypothetical protein